MSHGHRYDQTVARLEEEIEDIKKTLAGNYGTKHGTLLLMELERQEAELKAVREKQINNLPPAQREQYRWREHQPSRTR